MLLLLALSLLQQTQVAAPVLPASPVARIAIAPARLVVGASDSIHLSAIAYDASGTPIEHAGLKFSAAEANAGTVDSTGWVFARGTGKITGAVIALMPGYRPVVKRFEVLVVPDVPARVTIGSLPTTLAVGQHVRATAEVFNQLFRGLRGVGKVLDQLSGYDVTSYLEILQLFENRSDES